MPTLQPSFFRLAHFQYKGFLVSFLWLPCFTEIPESNANNAAASDSADVFSVISYNGDNFCDFLFTFLYTNLLLKFVYSPQIGWMISSFRRMQNNFDGVVSLESVSIPLKETWIIWLILL